MVITVETKVDGKYPAVTMGKQKFGTEKGIFDGLEIGKSYEVITKPRLVPNKTPGEKPYTFTDIVTVLGEAGTAGVVQGTNGVSGHETREKSIEKMSATKNDSISKAAVLKGAMSMVEACATVRGMTPTVNTPDEIYEWLKEVKNKELEANSKLLGVELPIPF